MKKKYTWLLTLVVLLAYPTVSIAQSGKYKKGDSFFQIDENKLIESRWKYIHTLHRESNTILHHANNNYEYYLYFRYDNTYRQYLNGVFSRGNWSVNQDQLRYIFKNIPKFTVVTLHKSSLVLEFNQPNSRGTFQYHFERVEPEDTPFVRPYNELPLVKVDAIQPTQKEKRWRVFHSPIRIKKKKQDTTQLPYISIELIGGGFYGGINPVLRDYIHIKSDGRLIKEFKTLQNGLVITKRNIPLAELKEFADYVISQDFFEMERIYDCEDASCQQRKQQKPTPVPLRLAIAYQNQRKVVTVSIFGKDKHNRKYVDYPPVLDKIIGAIQQFAFRLDPSS